MQQACPTEQAAAQERVLAGATPISDAEFQEDLLQTFLETAPEIFGSVRKALQDMTAELLELYARRKTARGYAFPPDTEWQREMEDAFEFRETPDQETPKMSLAKLRFFSRQCHLSCI